MSAWKYREVMPEAIVQKLRLIEPKRIFDLAGKPLEAIYSALADTPYSRETYNIPTDQRDATELEKALLANYVRTCKEIRGHSPGDISLLLSKILMKFEANAVKTMIRATVANLNVDEAMRHIVPVGDLDEAKCREILSCSTNISDFTEALAGSEFSLVLRGALPLYNETGVFSLIEVALDRFVYGEIWRATGKLRGLDKRIARTILGLEIDSMNIKAVLRCRKMGFDKDKTRRYLMPLSGVFGEKELEEAIDAVDLRASIDSLIVAAELAFARDYRHLLTNIRKHYETSESLLRLDEAIDRSLLRSSLKMLKRYTPFFNIGLILAFLSLKWFEVRNLTAIAGGAENRVLPDRIQRLLVLPD